MKEEKDARQYFRDIRPENIITADQIHERGDIVVIEIPNSVFSRVKEIPLCELKTWEDVKNRSLYYCKDTDVFYSFQCDWCLPSGYNLKTAFKYFSKDVYGPDERIKRIRQVRDALNKCRDEKRIEECAKILGC
ncbi:MAG: hypothetical protein KKD18_07260 [Nanoarchaeota archaeon]|nr:hypothetical protein [Nanoarchaeota archaeon]